MRRSRSPVSAAIALAAAGAMGGMAISPKPVGRTRLGRKVSVDGRRRFAVADQAVARRSCVVVARPPAIGTSPKNAAPSPSMIAALALRLEPRQVHRLPDVGHGRDLVNDDALAVRPPTARRPARSTSRTCGAPRGRGRGPRAGGRRTRRARRRRSARAACARDRRASAIDRSPGCRRSPRAAPGADRRRCGGRRRPARRSSSRWRRR